MNEATITTAAVDPPAYVCPRHPTVTLWNVLRGGAGWCGECRLYTQSANHPMPQLPPRAERVKVKVTHKKTASRKSTRSSKARIIAAQVNQ